MAVVRDATSSVSSVTQQTGLSWSHTVAGDADALYVALSIDGSGGTYSYNASATAGGVAMTRIHEGNTNQYLAVFRLLAPPTGTITIACSWTGAQYPSGNTVSFKGVDQTTPEGAISSSTNASGTSYSHAIASATGDEVFTVYSVNNKNTPLTATGDGTARVEVGQNPYTSVGVATAPGAATVNLGWSWSGGTRFSGASFNINAAGGGNSGAGSATLGPVVGAATGSLAIAGTAAGTIGAIVGSATSTLAVQGQAAGVVGPVVGGATGSLAVSGAASATLAPVVGAATGSLAIGGEGSAALPAIGGAATGSLAIAGQGAGQIGPVLGAGAGAGDVGGVGAGELGPIVQVATGSLAIAGAAAAEIGAVTGAAAGSLGSTGVGAGQIGPVVGAASGQLSVAGAAVGIIAPVVGAASATLAIAGGADATIGPIVGAGTGTGLRNRRPFVFWLR